MTTTEVAFKADLDRPLTGVDQKRIYDLLLENKRRACEALKLYRPLDAQEQFHQNQARIKLLIGGNRGGKSVGAAVEFARAVTGNDPYDKYPKTGGRAYVIGKSLKHIGDTIYPMLFRAGAFRMIRDEETQAWRTYRPWDPLDKARKELSRPAPPLIPQRYIKPKGIAWHSKAKREPARIDLIGDWEINFFSAEGRLPRGAQIDLAWPDEEIPASSDGEWIPELLARLMDRSGRLMWSATPHAGFDQLYDLFLKAEEQEVKYKLDPVKNPKPEIANFQFDLADNQYIPVADKVWFLSNLSAEEARVRGTGEFTVSSMRVYPEFNPNVHGYPMAGPPPANWTNYIFIDPGFTICAALFVTCPPIEECPDKQPIAIAYDELYIPQCNAPLFGARMKEKCEGKHFEAFYIDVHGAPREAGSGQSIREQYAQALRKNGVLSRVTGHDFLPAGDDRRAGVLAVHTMLVVRKEGGSHFRVAVEADDKASCKLPNLLFNMRRYRKKKIKGVVTDDTEDRGDTHLCQCMRYMALADPEWVEFTTKQPTWHDLLFDQVLEMTKRRTSQPGVYNLGPGE